MPTTPITPLYLLSGNLYLFGIIFLASSLWPLVRTCVSYRGIPTPTALPKRRARKVRNALRRAWIGVFLSAASAATQAFVDTFHLDALLAGLLLLLWATTLVWIERAHALPGTSYGWPAFARTEPETALYTPSAIPIRYIARWILPLALFLLLYNAGLHAYHATP